MKSKGEKLNGNLDTTKMKHALELLKCLTHPVRLSIINFISQEGEVNVNKIYNSLKLEQSITSQHLRVLRDNNIVTTTRNGKYILYSLNKDRLMYVRKTLNGFMETN